MANLAEVNCTPIRFQKGDRILVKVFNRINAEQSAHIKESVRNWAGKEVEVLVYCAADMEITLDERSTKEIIQG